MRIILFCNLLTSFDRDATIQRPLCFVAAPRLFSSIYLTGQYQLCGEQAIVIKQDFCANAVAVLLCGPDITRVVVAA
ncbi:MAG: hypothetical protein LBU24_05905 [Methanocalculaceae archaeon]|jgi:hypothetical protein|nr:hypothetical protein [Methanocalculaceae archaeon]